MRVILPYVDLWDETLDAVKATGYEYELRELALRDDAYWDLLASVWAEGETFCTVEQDVVVRPGSLKGLESCDREWCAYTVPYIGKKYAGLSCMKFDRRLMEDYPELLLEISGWWDEQHPPKHWCRLDAHIQTQLEYHGERLHIHEPYLQHLRKQQGEQRPSHGCWW